MASTQELPRNRDGEAALESAGTTGRRFPFPFDKESIATAIGSVNADAGLTFQSVSAQIDAMRAQERVVAMVSAFFGALALLIAGVGLYVSPRIVARRSREIAVRITLGAEPTSVNLRSE